MMACCSGKTQTKKIKAVVKFRPIADRQLQMIIDLQGRNGNWTGRNSGSYDFGNNLGCGQQLLIGKQTISIKLSLQCTETETTSNVQGSIQVSIAGNIFQGILVATPLTCIKGGPACTAEWLLLFVLGLGSTDVSIVGQRH